jgi:hypothetical protein
LQAQRFRLSSTPAVLTASVARTKPSIAVGGHIPGARNRFFRDNLDAAGRFRPASDLRREFLTLLAGIDPAQVVMSCGSGVTACHNLLAMEIAGLAGSAPLCRFLERMVQRPDAAGGASEPLRPQASTIAAAASAISSSESPTVGPVPLAAPIEHAKEQ